MIDNPDVPPAVIIQVDEGIATEYSVRPAWLINDGRREPAALSTDRFGPLTVTTTSGIADAFVQRPAFLVKPPLARGTEDAQ